MTPQDAIKRLSQLGASLNISDLPKIESVCICEDVVVTMFNDTVANDFSQMVMLNSSLMTPADIPAILHFSSLRSLNTNSFELSSVLLNQIAPLAHLESIAMSGTSITDADVAILTNRLRLKSIHFSGTQITDAAMKTFGTLPDLELLDVSKTPVTDDGLQHLHDLQNLFTIDLKETAVTPGGAKRYRKAVKHILPDVEALV